MLVKREYNCKDIVINPIDNVAVPMVQVNGFYTLGLDTFKDEFYTKNGEKSLDTDKPIQLYVSYTCMPANLWGQNGSGSFSAYDSFNFYRDYNGKAPCDTANLLLLKKWLQEEIKLNGGFILSNNFYSTENSVWLVPSDKDPLATYFTKTDYVAPKNINNGAINGEWVQFPYKFCDNETDLQYTFGTNVFDPPDKDHDVWFDAYHNDKQSALNMFRGCGTFTTRFEVPDISSYFNTFSRISTPSFLPKVGYNVYVFNVEKVKTGKVNSAGDWIDWDEDSYGITIVRVERTVVDEV